MIKRLIYFALTTVIIGGCNEDEPIPGLPNSVTIQVLSINLNTKTAELVATQPSDDITGLWTIESTNEVVGSFSDESDALATFYGGYFDEYLIRWTLTNGIESKFAEVTVLISEGATLLELFDLGISVEELSEQGYSPFELFEVGATIQEFLDANISVNQLYTSGINVSDLITAGITLDQLLEAEVTISDLLLAGVTPGNLISEGVSILELSQAGVLVGELKQNGVQNSELEDAGLIGFVNDTENNVYEWVKIGDQLWFSENLASTQFPNGTTISSAQAPANNESNVEIYGRLYNWNDAINNICPDGWHLPSENEWQLLIDFLESNVGAKMKTTGTLEDGNGLWRKDDPGDDGTNLSGFSGLPAGANTSYFSERAMFWTATQRDASTAWRPELIYHTTGIGYSYTSKTSKLSCRCIKD